MNTTDREYIENKYHRQDEPFNAYARWFYHGYEYDASTGLSDDEIANGLNALIPELDKLSHSAAKATAVKYVLDNTRIDINEHDYFIGIYTWARQANKVTAQRWFDELFSDKLRAEMDEIKLLSESGAASIWPDYDHVVPDFDSMMKLGFRGLLDRATEYKKKLSPLTDEQKEYFDGIEIEYSAALDFVKRLWELSKTKTHSKARAVEKCLEQLYNGAPTDTYEALQLIFIYFMISENVDFYQVRSFGNGLDYTLRPFWENDLASGKYTKEQLCEFLSYFFMQFSAIGNYWGHPFYLAGTNADGSSKVTDVSWDILRTYRSLGIYNPKIQIKVNYNTPVDFVNFALDMVRKSEGNLVFCCEPGFYKALTGYGATPDEARDFDIRGCFETGVKANEVCTATAHISLPKAVLYAMFDGYDNKAKTQIGIHTGNSEDFTSFEDFYFAVIKQLSALTERSIKTVNSYEKYLGYINPSPFYSATIEYSLKQGLDAYAKGVKFNNSSLSLIGFATAVDSIMVVKELVYDKKLCTMAEMKAALLANWEGYEALRAKALNLRCKYGNNDEAADTCAENLARYFAQEVNNRPNARGGVYKALLISAMHFVWMGEKVSATPDGRRFGEELSKNASPSVGMDRNGATAFVLSSTKLLPYEYHESFCTDVSLHPSAASGSDGLAAMKALIDVYMKNGGLAIQFNVVSPEMLRDAQAHPEKYKNLQIRVAGWNVLWNNIPKNQQDAYIRRAEANG